MIPIRGKRKTLHSLTSSHLFLCSRRSTISKQSVRNIFIFVLRNCTYNRIADFCLFR